MDVAAPKVVNHDEQMAIKRLDGVRSIVQRIIDATEDDDAFLNLLRAKLLSLTPAPAPDEGPRRLSTSPVALDDDDPCRIIESCFVDPPSTPLAEPRRAIPTFLPAFKLVIHALDESSSEDDNETRANVPTVARRTRRKKALNRAIEWVSTSLETPPDASEEILLLLVLQRLLSESR